MAQNVEINEGEVRIEFTTPVAGKQTFQELGLTTEQLKTHGGFLRLVFDLSKIRGYELYSVPTVELSYAENVEEMHWQCDFNGVTILDKLSHHGHSSVLLLNRKKITELEHHHENILIVHVESTDELGVIPQDSFINLFK